MPSPVLIDVATHIANKQRKLLCQRIAKEIILELNLHPDLSLASVLNLNEACSNHHALITVIERLWIQQQLSTDELQQRYREIKDDLKRYVFKAASGWKEDNRYQSV